MFLTIITWTYKRPTLLAKQRASLAMQTCQDFKQEVTEDTRGIGFEGVHRALQNTECEGEYIWIFDDDDIITDPTLIEKVKAVAHQNYDVENPGPEVIFVQSMWKPGIVHPDWPIRFGHISNINYIVRRDVWYKYRKEYAARSGGDGEFIVAVMRDRPVYAVVDGVMTATQVISRGRSEDITLRRSNVGETVVITEGCAGEGFSVGTGDVIQITESNKAFIDDCLLVGRAEYKDRPFRKEGQK
jgi:hypothetical protein